MIISPAAPLLGKKRLIIIADGGLQFIPFAALPDPASSVSNPIPMMIWHEISYSPSASVLGSLRKETTSRKSAPKLLALIADPVFDSEDVRLRQHATHISTSRTKGETVLGTLNWRDIGSELRLPRLPFSRLEAAWIYSLVGKAECMRALDFDASLATATSPAISRYQVVHFATHALLDTEDPALSGLVLSLFNRQGRPQPGFLNLNDIYNLKLSADLVVLSACQTGLGKSINGEGLIGLTRGFIYAGAPRVIASLWSVDDIATAELMKEFYTYFLRDHMRPAAALRKAQISLWQQKAFRSPYYWAPFVLQGEWK